MLLFLATKRPLKWQPITWSNSTIMYATHRVRDELPDFVTGRGNGPGCVDGSIGYCTVTLNSNFAILRGHNWMLLAHRPYLEFKLRFLKNLKSFSITSVKQLFEPIVLRKKATGFNSKSIFLRNRSFSNTGWFWGKKCTIGKGNLYLTENQLSWNKMWCASDD